MRNKPCKLKLKRKKKERKNGGKKKERWVGRIQEGNKKNKKGEGGGKGQKVSVPDR